VAPNDVKILETNSCKTEAFWHYIPNLMHESYVGAGSPLGHGSQRYVFTVIALDSPLHFEHPEKATKKDIQKAMIGKLVGWRQGIGVWQRPWSNKTYQWTISRPVKQGQPSELHSWTGGVGNVGQRVMCCFPCC
jgi:hypothetical protein